MSGVVRNLPPAQAVVDGIVRELIEAGGQTKISSATHDVHDPALLSHLNDFPNHPESVWVRVYGSESGGSPVRGDRVRGTGARPASRAAVFSAAAHKLGQQLASLGSAGELVSQVGQLSSMSREEALELLKRLDDRAAADSDLRPAVAAYRVAALGYLVAGPRGDGGALAT